MYWHFRTPGRRVERAAEEVAYDKEFHEHRNTLILRGFNEDDIWAREAMQAFYEDGWGWVKEHLFEADSNIVVWKKLANEESSGIQARKIFKWREPC